MKIHPHAEATYRVITLDDASFGVEITMPDAQPVTVSSFADEAAATAWIDRKKSAVASEMNAGKWFQRAGRRW